MPLPLHRLPPTHRVTLRRDMQPAELIKQLAKLPPHAVLRSVQGIGRAEPGLLRFSSFEEEEVS